MLDDRQLERYSRQIILPMVGEEGQLRLLQSKVLVIGVGGLGSPVLLYLAAAGVGTIGIVDFDLVDSSNLQRQVIHTENDISRSKVISAKERIEHLNSDVVVETHPRRLNKKTVKEICDQYAIIVDGSDNFATRYLVNKLAFQEKKILVTGALSGFEGQIMVMDPHRDTPCYRCIFPTVPDNRNVSRCDTVGVFGATAGVIGTLQATEVLKVILGLGTPLCNKMLLVDTLSNTYKSLQTHKDPNCIDCGHKV